MLKLLLIAAAAAASAAPDTIAEAEHAISVGRTAQARAMIGAAIEKGAQGEAVDRLLANLAFAEGKTAEAFARYQALLRKSPADPVYLERALLCAAKLGDVARGQELAARATSVPNASWRAWNARGVIADLSGDFPSAEAAYEQALTLAPEQGEILNNMGWSRLVRGDWAGALTPLERAAGLLPNSARVANNLEIAQAALAASLPERRPGEAEESWAARLNDAGVAAQLRGDRAKAIAAFAQAIEARPTWYARAANNLEALGPGR